MIKNIGSYIIPILTISILFYVSFNKTEQTIDSSNYSTKGLELDNAVNHGDNNNDDFLALMGHKTFTPHLGKSFVGFKEALAFKESQNNYFRVNTYGYLGKYQFGKETLKMIGVYNPAQFLKNPELQEKAFIANAARNKWILRREISRYVGKKVGGILVTESGILAAAHLAGPGSVKKYLRTYGQDNFEDAFGTSISYYMKKFAGYDTSFIEADRKAKVAVNKA